MSAVISKCQKYRYELVRTINQFNSKAAVVFLMLNPSVADASINDPTIRRCMRFADKWDHCELIVANLYALRSTDPKNLWKCVDPVGPENDAHLAQIASNYKFVVCAWGANAKPDRVQAVVEIFKKAGCKLMCLGVTRSGSPRHPLYIKGDTPLVEWEAASCQ